MGIETIIGIVGALGSLAGGVKGIVDSSNRGGTPTIAPAPVPTGPPADLTADELKGRAGSTVATAPNFLRFGSGMTNQQKRAQIATFGTQGGDSRYSDPATRDYWKKLVTQDYGQPGFSVLPTERMYAENVLGAKPRGDSTESFLSAILRG